MQYVQLFFILDLLVSTEGSDFLAGSEPTGVLYITSILLVVLCWSIDYKCCIPVTCSITYNNYN